MAPLTISITDGGSKMADLHLPIDTLALVHLDLTPEEVGVVLREAVEHQLQAVVLAMLWKVWREAYMSYISLMYIALLSVQCGHSSFPSLSPTPSLTSLHPLPTLSCCFSSCPSTQWLISTSCDRGHRSYLSSCRLTASECA